MGMRYNAIQFDAYSGTCTFFDICATSQEQRFNIIHRMPDWVGCRKIASSVLRCLLLMSQSYHFVI